MSAPTARGGPGTAAAETLTRRDAERERSAHEAGQRRRRRLLVGYVPMVLLALFFLFPLVFMFVSSLKPDAQILADVDSPRAFLPVGDISLDNFTGVFERVPVARFILNSVVVTVLVVGLGLVVNSMAGFALSRLEWRGRKLLLTVIIATLIVPFETIAIPMV